MKRWGLFVFLTAFLAALAILLPGILENRGILLLWGDFNHQQISFYTAAHESIRQGHYFWTMTTDLGADMMGAYSFYLLGSPFFWLTLPFPTEAVPYLMGPLMALKTGLMAWAAYLWLKGILKGPLAAAGGLMYAFSGFALTTLFWNHFMEPMLAFPLLLLGLDALTLKKRKGAFLLSVAFAAAVNYAFFPGAMIFLGIWLLVQWRSGRIALHPRLVFQGLTEFLLGTGLAMVILLPSFLAALGSGRTGFGDGSLSLRSLFLYPNEVLLHLSSSFFLPPEIQGGLVMVQNSYAWAGVSLWIPVLGGAGVLAFLFGRKGKIPGRRGKDPMARSLFIMIPVAMLLAAIPVFNGAFSLYAGEYYARWLYMPALLFIAAALMALETGGKREWFLGLGISFLAVAMSALLPLRGENRYLSADGPWILQLLGLAFLGLLLTAGLLWLRKKGGKTWIFALLFLLPAFSILQGSLFLSQGRSQFGKGGEEILQDLEHRNLLDSEDGLYRISWSSAYQNLSMLWGRPGIKSFTSLISPSLLPLYESLGNERTGVTTDQRPEQSVYPILTSVKYFIAREGEGLAMPGFRLLEEKEGYGIYEHEAFLEMGLFYDAYILKEDYEALTMEQREAVLLKGVVLTAEQAERWKGRLRELTPEEQQDASWESILREAEKKKANGSREAAYVGNQLRLTSGAGGKGALLITIPWSLGWKAYEGNAELPMEKASLSFLMVPVEGSQEEIRLIYEPPLWIYGGLISVISLGLSMIWVSLGGPGPKIDKSLEI